MLDWAAAGRNCGVASIAAVAAGHEDIVHDDGDVAVGLDREGRKAVADMANGLADLAEGTDGENERRSIVTKGNGMAKMRKAEEREGIADAKTMQLRWMRSSLWGLLPPGGQLALKFEDPSFRHLTRFFCARSSLFQNFLRERKHIARQTFPQNGLLDELGWIDWLTVVELLARRVSFNASDRPSCGRGGRDTTYAALLPLLQRTQGITGSRHRTR